MASTLYLDTGRSFSPQNFRNKFKDGVGSPAYFHFKLKRYPEIFYKGNRTSSIQGFINKYTGLNLDIISKVQNIGELIYENLNSRGLSDLVFKVNKALAPSRLIESFNLKYYGAGYEIPRDIESGVTNIAVFSSGTYWEHDFFSSWQASIIDYNKYINSPSFNVAYYDDIITEGEIIAYNEDGEPAYLISLEDIWPKEVGAIKFDWEGKDQIINFTVTFNYRLANVEKIAKSKQIKDDTIDKARSGLNTLTRLIF